MNIKKLKYLMMEQQSFFDKQWNRRWYGKINIGHSLISMMVLAAISIFLKRIVMAFGHLHFNAYGDNFYSSWCIHIHWNSGIHTNTLSLLLVPYLWLWIYMYVSCWNKVKIQITKWNWKCTSTKDHNKLISNIFFTFLLQFWTALNI